MFEMLFHAFMPLWADVTKFKFPFPLIGLRQFQNEMKQKQISEIDRKKRKRERKNEDDLTKFQSQGVERKLVESISGQVDLRQVGQVREGVGRKLRDQVPVSVKLKID